MDQEICKSVLSGDRLGPAAGLLRVALSAASAPYSAVMRARRWCYAAGLRRAKGAPVPVICVGNVTVGGTGKTPMVAWVVEQLKAAGAVPAVLTRGYKAVGGRSDEAELLKRLAGVPVIVDADRLAGAAEAAERGANVCVMDDGFQHLRLRHDLDIVLIDATNPFGYGRVLPRGLLREPLSALRWAHALVITRSDRVGTRTLEDIRRRLRRFAPRASLHAAVHEPACLIDEQGRQMPLSALAGRRVCAFCGLGNPQPFFDLLHALGADVGAREALGDHAVYDSAALERLRKAASANRCLLFLTTQKDFVKLPAEQFPHPVWQLAVRMKITEGQEELIASLRGTLRRPQ